MNKILAGAGVLAIIALAVWLIYLCGAKLIDIGAEDARIASIAEYAPKLEAWNLKASKDAAAMEAATLLINQSILSRKVTEPTIKVCVESVNPQGTLKRGPWLRDGYTACSKDQYTVTFPITYDAHGNATIGTPTVTR